MTAVTTRAPGCLVERCRNAPGQVTGLVSKGDLAAADRMGNLRRKAGWSSGSVRVPVREALKSAQRCRARLS